VWPSVDFKYAEARLSPRIRVSAAASLVRHQGAGEGRGYVFDKLGILSDESQAIPYGEAIPSEFPNILAEL